MKDDTISRAAALQTAERMYKRCDTSSVEDYHDLMVEALTALPSATDTNVATTDTISRSDAIALAEEVENKRLKGEIDLTYAPMIKGIKALPPAQQESKYEYHYDHTDCIWFRPEARNRCPSTCAQYRDGWNDAMNYIFRDGKGYRPYRRDQKYEG